MRKSVYKCASVRTVEKEGEQRKKRINRRRPRLHITISEENYNWLHEKTDNISNFIDSLITAVRSQIQPVAVVLSPLSGHSSGAGVAEPGKGAGLKTLSRRGPRVRIPPPAFFVFKILTHRFTLPISSESPAHRNPWKKMRFDAWQGLRISYSKTFFKDKSG